MSDDRFDNLYDDDRSDDDRYDRDHSAYDNDHGTDDHGTDDNDRDGSHSAEGNTLYRFDIANGRVTQVYEIENGRTQREDMDTNEVYSLSGRDVICTETQWGGQEVTTYRDDNGDGLFLKVSERWVASTGIDSGAPSLTPSWGSTNADRFVIRDLRELNHTHFRHEEGDHLVFDTGRGYRSVDELLSHVTEVHEDARGLHVRFDQDDPITLTGVRACDIRLDDLSVLS